MTQPADELTLADARALFERLVLKFPADKARNIWDTWARYEYMYSDLSACQKLEARFAEAYPNGEQIDTHAEKPAELLTSSLYRRPSQTLRSTLQLSWLGRDCHSRPWLRPATSCSTSSSTVHQ